MLQLNTNIKLIRELSGKGQQEFAKLIKTNVSNLKTYENTAVRPKANVLAEIADYANITIDDLEKKKLTHKDIKLELKKDEKDEKKEDGQFASQAERMLAELIRAHNKQADSLKDVSEANLIWARNTENLIEKMKNMSEHDHQTLQESVAMILGLQEYLVELGAHVNKIPKKEVQQILHNKVKRAMERGEKKDILSEKHS